MLFPLHLHQTTGLEYLLSREESKVSKISGSILADQMGLGKTIQTIALIEQSYHTLTILFCPSSLVAMWKEQIPKFSDTIYVGIIDRELTELDKCLHQTSHPKTVILCSYGLSYRRKILQSIEFDRIVCDEAHYFRNPKSKTFLAINSMKSKSRLAITATPIQNSIRDMVTMINFILKLELKLNIDFIKLFLKERMISRNIASVGLELPKLKVINVDISPTGDNRRVVKLTNSIAFNHHLEKMIRTKQSCVFPKMLNHTHLNNANFINSSFNQKTDTIIKTIIEKKERCIVFTEFITEQHYMYERLKDNFKVATIRGATTLEDRAAICSDLTYDILLIQIQTGCVGLNLQHFSRMYFSNIQWNPTVTQQAIGRINRIGQKHDMEVYIYKLEDTIEQHIHHIAKTKLEVIDSILN
jgi:SNF2 family DNA or RNA helicase